MDLGIEGVVELDVPALETPYEDFLLILESEGCRNPPVDRNSDCRAAGVVTSKGNHCRVTGSKRIELHLSTIPPCCVPSQDDAAVRIELSKDTKSAWAQTSVQPHASVSQRQGG